MMSLIPMSLGGTQVETAPADARRAPLAHVIATHQLASTTMADGSITLTNQLDTLVLFPNARRTLFNGLTLYMNGEFDVKTKEWTLSTTDVQAVLLPLLEKHHPAADLTNALVVIDAGHGGTDSGTQSASGTSEKTLVLDIAKRVEKHLQASHIATRMTRTNDVALTLSERTTMAHQWGGNLMVSIHLNSSSSPNARGAETYVVPAFGFPSTSNGTTGGQKHNGNGNDIANGLLAFCIHRELLAATAAPDRGIRRARFNVLNQSHCPAVLVECGFLSNPQEAKALSSHAYREKIAKGIASGIAAYLQGPSPKGATNEVCR